MNQRFVARLGAALTLCGCGSPDLGNDEPAAPPVAAQAREIRDGTPSAVEDVVELEVYSQGKWQTWCSGTALRNDVILTAQHCLGVPVGFGQFFRLLETPGHYDESSPEEMSWRVKTEDGQTAVVWGVVRLAEQNYVPTVVENDYWLAAAADPTTVKSDAALLILDSKLTFFGTDRNHVRDISRTPSAQMDGSLHLCVGYGNNAGTAGGGTGAGTQRWGLVEVFQPTYHPADSRYVQYFPNYSTEKGIIPMQGDSGGPCFRLHDGYWWQVASVHSYQNTTCPGCDTVHYAAQQTGAEIFRSEARLHMDFFAGQVEWSFGSMPSGWQSVTPSPLYDGPPSWHVQSGQLRENSNARGSSTTYEGPLFLKDGIHANVEVKVRVRSSDNDAAGLVLRYYDADHYYRAAFDEERRYLRIYKRSGGETTVLGTRQITFDHSNDHVLVFKAWEGKLRATLTGSDVNVTLTVNDNSEDALMNGRAGIYEWGLENARFDDFSVTPLFAAF